MAGHAHTFRLDVWVLRADADFQVQKEWGCIMVYYGISHIIILGFYRNDIRILEEKMETTDVLQKFGFSGSWAAQGVGLAHRSQIIRPLQNAT